MQKFGHKMWIKDMECIYGGNKSRLCLIEKQQLNLTISVSPLSLSGTQPHFKIEFKFFHFKTS